MRSLTDAVAAVFRDAEAQRAVDVDARLAATMILRGQFSDEQLAAMSSEKGWRPAGGGSTLFYDTDRGAGDSSLPQVGRGCSA